jgi:hypothetical protein
MNFSADRGFKEGQQNLHPKLELRQRGNPVRPQIRPVQQHAYPAVHAIQVRKKMLRFQ